MTREAILKVAAQIEAMGYVLRENRVAVIRDEGAAQVGHIIIPEASKDKPLSGFLVAIGAGIREDQRVNGDKSRYAGLEIGDWLTFSKYDGTLFQIPLLDDTVVKVEVLHGFDIYFSCAMKRSVI